MEKAIKIVSTKKLQPNQKQFLLNADFRLIEADFIQIEFQKPPTEGGLHAGAMTTLNVNVGGEMLDAALARIRMHARIVICGAISQYNNTGAIKGPSNYLSLLVNRGTMQGMVVMDYAKNYRQAAQEMGTWMAEGRLISREDIYDGIENFHETFTRLFTGEKLGKLVLKVIE